MAGLGCHVALRWEMRESFKLTGLVEPLLSVGWDLPLGLQMDVNGLRAEGGDGSGPPGGCLGRPWRSAEEEEQERLGSIDVLLESKSSYDVKSLSLLLNTSDEIFISLYRFFLSYR